MTRTHVFVVALAVCLFAVPGAGAQGPPPGGAVTLPLEDYQALRARARQAGATPPARATLTRIDYALAADGELVTGEARLTIDVQGTGWVAVPLPGGLAIGEARLDGQPLVVDAGPPPTVHLSRAGRAVLHLTLALVPAEAAGTVSVSLPASTAAITRVALDIPGTAHRVTASGGVVVDRVERENRTSWTIHARSAAPLVIDWTRRREDPRASAPVRLAATFDTTVGIRDALMQLAVTATLDVRQGLAREAALLVPVGVSVTTVSGDTVDDWRVEDRVLRVLFVEPVGARARLDIRAEAPAVGDAVTIPLLRLPAAEREIGTVAVDVGQEAEVVDARVAGLDTVDARATTGMRVVATPSARTFRFHPASGASERRLDITIARYAAEAVPVATIDEARVRAFAAASGRVLVEARYLVRNNQRSALAVRLPGGARLWQARVGDRAVRPGRADDGRLVLPLDTARAGDAPATSVVTVVYLWHDAPWTSGSRATVALPAIDLPVARSAVLLHHPPRMRVAVDGGPFRVSDDLDTFAAPLGEVQPRATFADARSGAPPEVLALVAEARGVLATVPVEPQADALLDFPQAGPSVFLRAELTPELVAPVLVLSLQKR